jgi:hypothetical protein
VLPMGSRYSPKWLNGPLPEIPSLLAAVLARGAAGLQPGPRRFCGAGGVHGELEAGPSLGVRGIAGLLSGGEAATENLREPAGDLGGRRRRYVRRRVRTGAWGCITTVPPWAWIRGLDLSPYSCPCDQGAFDCCGPRSTVKRGAHSISLADRRVSCPTWPVTRVGLDAGAWDALPTRLVVDVGRAGQDRPVSRSSTDEPDSNHSASRPPRGGSGLRSEEG